MDIRWIAAAALLPLAACASTGSDAGAGPATPPAEMAAIVAKTFAMVSAALSSSVVTISAAQSRNRVCPERAVIMSA